MLKVRKRHLKYLGPILRKIGLENLSFAGHIKGKRDREENNSNIP